METTWIHSVLNKLYNECESYYHDGIGDIYNLLIQPRRATEFWLNLKQFDYRISLSHRVCIYFDKIPIELKSDFDQCTKLRIWFTTTFRIRSKKHKIKSFVRKADYWKNVHKKWICDPFLRNIKFRKAISQAELHK